MSKFTHKVENVPQYNCSTYPLHQTIFNAFKLNTFIHITFQLSISTVFKFRIQKISDFYLKKFHILFFCEF